MVVKIMPRFDQSEGIGNFNDLRSILRCVRHPILLKIVKIGFLFRAQKMNI